MIALLWNIGAALRGYLRVYMPTNVVIDWLRTPRGVKWAIPVAHVAAPAYLFATSICATIIASGGPGYLNVLVILFFWNAAKFAWLAFTAPFLMLRTWTGAHRTRDQDREVNVPAELAAAGECLITNQGAREHGMAPEG